MKPTSLKSLVLNLVRMQYDLSLTNCVRDSDVLLRQTDAVIGEVLVVPYATLNRRITTLSNHADFIDLRKKARNHEQEARLAALLFSGCDIHMCVGAMERDPSTEQRHGYVRDGELNASQSDQHNRKEDRGGDTAKAANKP